MNINKVVEGGHTWALFILHFHNCALFFYSCALILSYLYPSSSLSSVWWGNIPNNLASRLYLPEGEKRWKLSLFEIRANIYNIWIPHLNPNISLSLSLSGAPSARNLMLPHPRGAHLRCRTLWPPLTGLHRSVGLGGHQGRSWEEEKILIFFKKLKQHFHGKCWCKCCEKCWIQYFFLGILMQLFSKMLVQLIFKNVIPTFYEKIWDIFKNVVTCFNHPNFL